MQILKTQEMCELWTSCKEDRVYSQTLEKRSSDPPNPPDLVLFVVLETGAALVQPPKSSSAATAGAGLEDALGAPQPWPTSFGVNVSGTFIMDAGENAAGPGDEAGSGVLHAFPPHGSRLPDIMLAAAAFAALVTGALRGAEGCIGGAEILNADVISC